MLLLYISSICMQLLYPKNHGISKLVVWRSKTPAIHPNPSLAGSSDSQVKKSRFLTPSPERHPKRVRSAWSFQTTISRKSKSWWIENGWLEYYKLMAEILHQWIVYPTIYKVLDVPGGAGCQPSTVSFWDGLFSGALLVSHLYVHSTPTQDQDKDICRGSVLNFTCYC